MLPKQLINSELEKVVCSLIDRCGEIYLVGGVVRDYVLKIPCNDIDFVVKREAIGAARKVADHFKGDFYILDNERGTARALINFSGNTLIVDFSTQFGENIAKDLEQRDFTINAIAQKINETWNPIDPLGGVKDLENKKLRPCSSSSYALDPNRTIRAVRFIQKFDLEVEKDTIKLLKDAVPLLNKVSLERKRDEVFHIFETKNIKSSMTIMREFGLWDEIFPSLEELEKIDNIPPHVHDVLGHTLSVLEYCQMMLQSIETNDFLFEGHFQEPWKEIITAYGKDLKEFLANPIHPQRKFDGLLYLGVLYHDIGKLEIAPIESDGRLEFQKHAEESVRFFRNNCRQWALSNSEYQFISRVVENHTLSKEIKDTEDEHSRRAIYRFFRKADSAGVLIAIFHLADILATYENTLTEERWHQAIETCEALLESWFRKHDQIINIPVLLTGSDLIHKLNFKQGRQLGLALEAIREEQAAGNIKNKNMAIEYANTLDKMNGK